jgi:hypothetical protein
MVHLEEPPLAQRGELGQAVDVTSDNGGFTHEKWWISPGKMVDLTSFHQQEW